MPVDHVRSSKSTRSAKIRIGMMSLGCPKTLVDSELILGKLDPARFTIVASVGDCDVALLNTCSFIKDAQEESIDRILELIELKKQKQIQALIVMGCFVQQYPKELQKEFAEVDAFVGSGEYEKIADVIQGMAATEAKLTIGAPGYLYSAAETRVALTPKFYRYMKISEGCDHICSFCTIPSFRGKHRSRQLDDVVQEARQLVAQGAKELILTGQDTSYFGRDYAGRFLLPDLLHELNQVEGIEWIRVLYAYPSCITSEYVEAIRDCDKVCHYLDMPLQHASDAMLTAMRRGITKRRTCDLLKEFRSKIPDIAMRTTFIVGFPGETEKDFEELLQFMQDIQFDRLGIFTYSNEEHSHASTLPNHVPEAVKEKRLDQAMRLQQTIAFENNRKLIGREFRVLIEGPDEKQVEVFRGRSYMDAPEVDGNVFVHTSAPLKPGSFISAKVTDTQDYDLIAWPT